MELRARGLVLLCYLALSTCLQFSLCTTRRTSSSVSTAGVYPPALPLATRGSPVANPFGEKEAARRRKTMMAVEGEGPGSYPPRCAYKCGNCTPCRPVHMAVPPGTPVTAEYYPEAWRCKCRNRLFMP